MATNANRLRPPPLEVPSRGRSPNSTDSDDSDSSPDQERDEEAAYFLTHANDSQSTICAVSGIKDDVMEIDTSQRHRLTPISKLPPELLIAIFSKLTTTADLRNCMLVSYHWALYSVSILWHRPMCNKWPNLQNVARTLADGRPTFPYNEMVKRLNLSAVADKVNDGTAQAFKNCKGIERLTLTSCSKLTDFGVSQLVDGSKRLQALDVTDLGALTDRTMVVVAANCAKLQGLNITNCLHVTDESLVAIAENCRQLKRLKLNGVFRATDLSIIAVARNCRSILEIDLAGCELITSESVTALLSNLPHLRELRLAQCTDITDTAFTNLPPRIHFVALRILDLTQCEQVKDDAIARIIPAAPRLRNLVLAKCRHITDRAVDAICKLTKNLHYIHLGHCTNLTDAAVINLVKHCNRIRYIDLACCAKLTDASVRHLAQLPKLRRIGLVKCQNLTDNSILALAHGPLIFSSSDKVPVPSQFVSLERVHLSYCINLTLKGITALLHNCPRLTHLSLTGVQAFLQGDLTQFCRAPPPEFTHPQRDVFCVFSGDGVMRLRDHLTKLAIDEAEREHRMEMEGSIPDPDDSPGADTMSDDGTVDGNDHPGSAIYPDRYRAPSAGGSRRYLRPRSMQDLYSQQGETPSPDPERMPRSGSWTPNGLPMTPAAHLNLTSSNRPLSADAEWALGTITPHHAPLSVFDFDRAFGDAARSRSQTRRHTLESAASFYTPPSPGNSAFAPGPFRPFGTVEDPRLNGPPSGLLPPTPQTASNHAPGSHAQSDSFAGQPCLRPEPEFSAFDANHEAIMSTIPNGGGIHPSSSPASGSFSSRLLSRGRMGRLMSNRTPLASSPSSPLSIAELATRLGRGDWGRDGSEHRGDSHREAVLRAFLAAEADQLRPASAQSANDRGTGAATSSADRANRADQTSVSPATSRSSSQFAVPRDAPAGSNHDDAQDVDMSE